MKVAALSATLRDLRRAKGDSGQVWAPSECPGALQAPYNRLRLRHPTDCPGRSAEKTA
jgi:hypothetical protein